MEHPIIHEIIAKRERLGWAQGKLGDIAGIGRTTMKRIEEGKANPTLKNLEAIANALHMELRLVEKSK